MNFVEEILSNGFVRAYYYKQSPLYPSNAWMGLTIYHPYERFEKGKIVIELSLEQYNKIREIRYSDGTLKKEILMEKRITVKNDGIVTYDNKYGIFPPKEIFNICH